MLITAGDEEKIQYHDGQLGRRRRILGKNVVTCYIRPQRYTKEFVDANDTFTLSFYGPEYKTPQSSGHCLRQGPR